MLFSPWVFRLVCVVRKGERGVGGGGGEGESTWMDPGIFWRPKLLLLQPIRAPAPLGQQQGRAVHFCHILMRLGFVPISLS